MTTMPESTTTTSAEEWAGDMGARWLANLSGFENTIAPVGKALLARAAYRPGERVVDIGCGGGATSLAIARAVAPGGEVLGIDISPDLLAATAGRALAAGLTHARFLCADVATVAPNVAPFDRLCSRFGSMFFAEPAAAFANLRRLLQPGGRIDLAVWASPDDNPWMQSGVSVARRYLDLPAPVPRAPGPFAFADLTYLRDVLGEAGFMSIDVVSVEGELSIGGHDATPEVARDFACKALAFGRLLREAGGDIEATVREELLALYASHHRPGEGVMMGYKAWLVAATA